MYKKITLNRLRTMPMLMIMAILSSLCVFSQTFEAEDGILAGGASVQGCDSCSGSIVGNISNTGTVTIAATVASAGWYSMQTFYCTNDPRTFSITPGDGATLIVPVQSSGGWSTAVATNISIYLDSGTTNVVFASPSWGPNLDKIVLSPISSSQIQTIAFGTNNNLKYDLTNKTYNVEINGVTVISGAASYAFGNESNYSTGYSNVSYSSEAFTDNIGNGTKHIFTLSGGYSTNMQQIFYTYTGEEYLAVQVALTGTGANCYRMSPLTSYNVSPDFQGDETRALNVPYDNDAWVRYIAASLEFANFTGSEVTNLYSNQSRHSLLLGSIDNTRWKTGVNVQGGSSGSGYVSVINGYTNQALTRDTRGHGWINIGLDYCPSAKMIIIADDDWRTAFEKYGELSALMQPKYITDWTDSKPMGWNSWGAIQTNINLQKAKDVVDFFDSEVPTFRTEDNTLYIDLDSYWDNMTDTQLAQFVTYAESKGFKAGIYWAPFVDWGKYSRLVEGSVYNYTQTWTQVNGSPFEMTSAYAMDPTHPATKQRIDYFIQKFINAGFTMVKLDFLIHASVEADYYYNWQVHTGMEAYHEGMEYLIDAIGDSMLVEVAISPNMATGPYAHMRRIACDAYGSIGDSEYTLNSTTYGWWQRKMYNYMDADNVVFGNYAAGANRARLTSSIVTGTITVGDDYSATGPWTTTAQNLLENADILSLMQPHINFIPESGDTSNTASKIFYATYNGKTYVALFNYTPISETTVIQMDRIGLDGSTTYDIKELYSGQTSTNSGALSVTMPSSDAHIYEFTGPTAATDDVSTVKESYLFPNPANEYVKIQFGAPVGTSVSVNITDISGKQVWKKMMDVDGIQTPQIPVNQLTKGLYIVTVDSPVTGVQNFKFIKQ